MQPVNFSLINWNRINSDDGKMLSLTQFIDLNKKLGLTDLDVYALSNKVQQRIQEFDTEFYIVIQSDIPHPDQPFSISKHYGLFDFDIPVPAGRLSSTQLMNVKQLLLECIKYRMQCEGLSGYLYDTNHGYHLIVTNRIFDSFEELNKMGKKLKCCNGFIKMGEHRGYYGLRVGYKVNTKPDITLLQHFPDSSFDDISSGDILLYILKMNIVEPVDRLINVHDKLHSYLQNIYYYNSSGEVIAPIRKIENGKATGVKQDSFGNIVDSFKYGGIHHSSNDDVDMTGEGAEGGSYIEEPHERHDDSNSNGSCIDGEPCEECDSDSGFLLNI